MTNFWLIIILIISIGIPFFLAYAEMKGKKPCPFCKEYINKEATKCPKCQSVLEEGK